MNDIDSRILKSVTWKEDHVLFIEELHFIYMLLAYLLIEVQYAQQVKVS